MHKTVVTGALVLAVSGPAFSQIDFSESQAGEAVAAITTVGATCERVVRSQTIGELDDESTLLAVACREMSEQYVLQRDPNGNMTFFATCEKFAAGTNHEIGCFRQTERGKDDAPRQ